MRMILILACFAFAAPSERLPMPQELQAEQMPWFAFAAKDDKGAYGGVINRDNLKEIAKERKSRRVVFSFFATWCVPCREGLRRMGEGAEELRKGGVLVVLVNVAETDLDNYDYAKIDKWAGQYMKEGWLLGFNKFSNSLERFGFIKAGDKDAPLPRTLAADADLRPLALIGYEGDDYLKLLMGE